MFQKNKLAKAFKLKKPEPRPRSEIDRLYADHAIQAGHKARVALQLQEEVDHHIQQMKALNVESMSLPPETPPTPSPTEQKETV